jgi:hypothetical protein
MTKHTILIYWLLLGRVLGGIATSLLFSVFESWYVSEHNNAGYDQGLLSETLSLGVLVNSLSAIASGVLAQSASEAFPFAKSGVVYWGGYTAPFDLAILVLLAGMGMIAVFWSEGKVDRARGFSTASAASASSSSSASAGAAGGGAGFGTQGNWGRLVQAAGVVWSSRLILGLGAVPSLFEGAMYSVVFMWTPALSAGPEGTPAPPLGTIFSTFMVACMAGSQVFGVLVQRGWAPHNLLTLVLIVSALSLSMGPVAALLGRDSRTVQYAGFLAFELCCGLYFPAMGTLKSQVVPEQFRATIYNLVRVPLNVIVLVVLLGNFSVNATFSLCVLLLAAATVAQLFVAAILNAGGANGHNGQDIRYDPVSSDMDVEMEVSAKEANGGLSR